VPRKPAIARELLRQPHLLLSVQVLNEFTANARNPSKINFSPIQEQDWIRRWLLFEVAPFTVETYLSAQLIHARFQTSHRDSLILASSQELGCETLFSENLNQGRKYGSVTVINPFNHVNPPDFRKGHSVRPPPTFDLQTFDFIFFPKHRSPEPPGFRLFHS
jgi:predicted nucleic acid-binding protein